MSDYADPEDLTVQRDDNDELLPQDVEVDRFGTISVIPMTYGRVQTRFGDGQEFEFDTEELAEMFDRHIVEPDLSEAAGGTVTPEYVEEMYPDAPSKLLLAIMEASGVEADVEGDADGGATVEVEGN